VTLAGFKHRTGNIGWHLEPPGDLTGKAWRRRTLDQLPDLRPDPVSADDKIRARQSQAVGQFAYSGRTDPLAKMQMAVGLGVDRIQQQCLQVGTMHHAIGRAPPLGCKRATRDMGDLAQRSAGGQ
jgi:hypothetical protein